MKSGSHTFTILGRILTDPHLEIDMPKNASVIYMDALHKTGDVIWEYVDQWDLTGDLQKKLELLWINVLIYGIGRLEKSGNFNADFADRHMYRIAC